MLDQIGAGFDVDTSQEFEQRVHVLCVEPELGKAVGEFGGADSRSVQFVFVCRNENLPQLKRVVSF